MASPAGPSTTTRRCSRTRRWRRAAWRWRLNTRRWAVFERWARQSRCPRHRRSSAAARRSWVSTPRKCWAKKDSATRRLQGSEFREAVRAPLFRADAVVDDEQPVRFVLSLDVCETSVIAAPIRLLPSRFEVVALADVRAGLACDRAELPHAPIDSLRGLAACIDRWLV